MPEPDRTARPYADLHAHTTASDGTLTPTELIEAAQAAGIALLAVTDHDTTAGVAEAQRAAERAGIVLVPGVEISIEEPYPPAGTGKFHLLGLGIDPENAALNGTLARVSAARRERNGRIVERLQRLGVAVTLEEVAGFAPPGANIGRPHFAAALVARGAVSDTREAFARYLADGAAAYVGRETLGFDEAVGLLHEAGGLCFLAHPILMKLASHETLETRIRMLESRGLDGIEAYYSQHTPADEARLLRLAGALGLQVCGGSDFHGAHKPETPLGMVRDGAPLPLAQLAEPIRRLGVRRPTGL